MPLLKASLLLDLELPRIFSVTFRDTWCPLLWQLTAEFRLTAGLACIRDGMKFALARLFSGARAAQPVRKCWFEGPDSRLATATTRALASAGTRTLASVGKRKLGRGGLPSPLLRDPLEAMREQALIESS